MDLLKDSYAAPVAEASLVRNKHYKYSKIKILIFDALVLRNRFIEFSEINLAVINLHEVYA